MSIANVLLTLQALQFWAAAKVGDKCVYLAETELLLDSALPAAETLLIAVEGAALDGLLLGRDTLRLGERPVATTVISS